MAETKTRFPVITAGVCLAVGFVIGAMFATAMEGGRGVPAGALAQANHAADQAEAAARDAESAAAPPDAGPVADGHMIYVPSSIVVCMDPQMLGLARAAWAAWAKGMDDADAKDAFIKSGCVPPVGGPGTRERVHHRETILWRGKLDGQWLGGNLEVAELRSVNDGMPLISWVAAPDLTPAQ